MELVRDEARPPARYKEMDPSCHIVRCECNVIRKEKGAQSPKTFLQISGVTSSCASLHDSLCIYKVPIIGSNVDQDEDVREGDTM